MIISNWLILQISDADIDEDIRNGLFDAGALLLRLSHFCDWSRYFSCNSSFVWIIANFSDSNFDLHGTASGGRPVRARVRGERSQRCRRHRSVQVRFFLLIYYSFLISCCKKLLFIWELLLLLQMNVKRTENTCHFSQPEEFKPYVMSLLLQWILSRFTYDLTRILCNSFN